VGVGGGLLGRRFVLVVFVVVEEILDVLLLVGEVEILIVLVVVTLCVIETGWLSVDHGSSSPTVRLPNPHRE